MEEILLQVGSVVIVEDPDDIPRNYMIIGHRIINHSSMNAWDYVSVKYPDGLKRFFKHDKSYDYDDYFYFNHFEIEKVIHKNSIEAENLERK
ncbi:DUF4176 domain-containing protein [Halalkalibacter sp. APA_J-10(15)]|uniref:DUF4176 domain-containing protein n=1 Tax=Halalkalibacter sp. APA_J-10(15) TaxID=2933805 RepID=UPI001FF5F818|nr:DUF4176 domain-containing protein [Halalkalibacter sp. APA_J-10(15)]MCK0471410.1 DUF4176 domain-containing protein [Halalkalibacter sp. APA_J-10(15)]